MYFTTTTIAALAALNNIANAAPLASVIDNGDKYHYLPGTLKHLAPKSNTGALVFHYDNTSVQTGSLKSTPTTAMDDTIVITGHDHGHGSLIEPRGTGDNGPCQCSGHGNWCGSHANAGGLSHRGMIGNCDPNTLYTCSFIPLDFFWYPQQHLHDPKDEDKCDTGCMSNQFKTDRCLRKEETEAYMEKEKARLEAERVQKEQDEKEQRERKERVKAKDGKDAVERQRAAEEAARIKAEKQAEKDRKKAEKEAAGKKGN